MMENNYYGIDVEELANNDMDLIRKKKIRKHILGNSSGIHTGKQEYEEYVAFRDFINTRNGMMIENLRGNEVL